MRASFLLLTSLLLAAAEEDWYAILGLGRQATTSQIRSAYRKLSLKLHPDKHVDSPAAVRKSNQRKFEQVTEAYAVLGDPDKRAVFDEGVEGFTSQYEYQRSRNSGSPARDFYEGRRNIVTVTQHNFDQVVDRGQHDHPVLVDFYAPWCVHCQQMTPEWKKAALALEGKAVLAAVNCENSGNLCQMVNIHAYPTVVLYWQGEIQQYRGQLLADALVDYVGQNTVNTLVDLTETSFGPRVLSSTDLWLVDYYAPWCGPCNRLKPTLRRVGYELAQARLPVQIGLVDCTQYGHLCDGIPHYPSIKVFRSGQKSTLDSGTLLDWEILNSRDMASAQAIQFTAKLLGILLEPRVEGEQAHDDPLGSGREPPMVFLDPEIEAHSEL